MGKSVRVKVLIVSVVPILEVSVCEDVENLDLILCLRHVDDCRGVEGVEDAGELFAPVEARFRL